MRKHLRVSVPGPLICLFLTVMSVSQASWQQYSYPEDRFTFSAPSRPALARQTTQTAVGPKENRTYLVELGPNIGFMISAVDFKQDATVPVKTLLQGAKEGAASNSKSTVTKEQAVSLDGYPGLEFELENAAFHSRVRCFLVDGKLLTVMALAPAGKAFAPETERLFTSLHLIKKPA